MKQIKNGKTPVANGMKIELYKVVQKKNEANEDMLTRCCSNVMEIKSTLLETWKILNTKLILKQTHPQVKKNISELLF